MSSPQVVIATWSDGLFVIGTDTRHELSGSGVRGLVSDRRGGLLAIVNGTTLRRRAADGAWQTLAQSPVALACCLALPDAILVGTDDARVLRLTEDGELEPVPAFDRVAGRDTWYAGTAVIDGQLRGPPLGVRSMCATCDDRTILVSVHVGGINRSTDGGRSWQPTIDIDADVHQVCAHPLRAELVVAAAAVGLCVSTDGGASWSKEHDGLHAPHCSAVAFSGDDVLVAAASDPFASQGAVYRRSLTAGGALRPMGSGLPRWLEGSPDTACVATRDAHIAMVDRGGCLYRSADRGQSWSLHAARPPTPSGVVIG
jgi:photosystem II stability/assembly factor-like uncharacterized protein